MYHETQYGHRQLPKLAHSKYSNTAALFAMSLLLMLMASMVQAGSITGTGHDLVSQGFDAGENCVICHTPHNSDISVTTTPLWGQQPPSSTYDMYFTRDENIREQPTGASKLCLSCHDGVTAIDKFGDTGNSPFIGGNASNVSSNEKNKNHPLSIPFDSALAARNPSLYDPAVKQITIGIGGDRTRTGTIDELMLSNGRVQCNSCHDVHNNYVGDRQKDQPFLKVTRSGSQICLTCHNK